MPEHADLHETTTTRELSAILQKSRPNSVNAEVASRSTAHVKWLGKFSYQVYADGHTFNFDGSERFPSLETRLTPFPLLLASIGTSLSTRYIANAANRGITIDALDIWVEGVIDTQTKDNVGDLQVKVYLKSDATRDTIEKLHAYTVQDSPFSKELANRIDLAVEKIASDWSGLLWCESQ